MTKSLTLKKCIGSYFILFLFFAHLGAKADTQEKTQEILKNLKKDRLLPDKQLAIEMAEVRGKRDKVEMRLAQIESEIFEVQEESKELKRYLRERLKWLRRIYGADVVRILEASRSLGEVQRFGKLLFKATEKDLLTFKSIRAAEIIKKRQALEFKKKRQTFESLSDSYKEKEAKLFAEMKKRDKLFQQKSHSSLLGKLKKEGSFFSQKGDLPWPVSGRLVQRYGIKRDLSEGVSFVHPGILIAANETQIKSVAGGKVVAEQKKNNWGTVVVVEHEETFYSVYAGHFEASVKLGDYIKGNQTLGEFKGLDSWPEGGRVPFLTMTKGAASGDDSINHLYFEVRYLTETLDPADWLVGI